MFTLCEQKLLFLSELCRSAKNILLVEGCHKLGFATFLPNSGKLVKHMSLLLLLLLLFQSLFGLQYHHLPVNIVSYSYHYRAEIM